MQIVWSFVVMMSSFQRISRSGKSVVVDTYIRVVPAYSCIPDLSSFEVIHRFEHITNEIIVKVDDVTHALMELQNDSCISETDVFKVNVRLPRYETCNDPYFMYQRTYMNTANIPEAWNLSSGANTFMIIVDDGINEHLDIPVFRKFNVVTNFSTGSHGSKVASVSAARRNNYGICGVSWRSPIVDINLLANMFMSDVQEALAFDGEHIQWNAVYCSSWGPTDDGRCEQPGRLLKEIFRKGVIIGRRGYGAIYVFASGNGGSRENVNADGYANSIYTIAVTGLQDTSIASFSEWGSCITVSAPGYQILSANGIHGFSYFYGTSAAAPIVSGIIAMMLDVNPNLGWRDVQEIVMTSAQIFDMQSFSANSAGRMYSHVFGSGVVNAIRAVNLAKHWINLPPQINATSVIRSPINSPALFIHSIPERFRIEHVRVCTTINGPGHTVSIRLRSPSGSAALLNKETTRVSLVMECEFKEWCFSSLVHWGESSNGTWTVRVRSAQPTRIEYMELQVFGANVQQSFHSCVS